MESLLAGMPVPLLALVCPLIVLMMARGMNGVYSQPPHEMPVDDAELERLQRELADLRGHHQAQP